MNAHGRANATEESVIDALVDRDLFVVSNREPYTHSHDGDDVTVSQPAGGLTAALDPIMRRLSGTWIAWGSGDADFDVADDRGRVDVPPEDPSYTIQRLHLSDRELSGYYYGYSNQVLWPLCHAMPTRATFDGEFWNYYRRVNETFADALAKCADGNEPVVWFQDYHLALAPRFTRQRLPEAFLTQFWHVPWPAWETYRVCPHHRELLEGLLANDLLGFHSESYSEAFCECVSAAFDDATVDVDAGRIAYRDHLTRVRSSPLGIDADRHASYAASRDADRFWGEFAATHELGNSPRIAVGVDRLDYTKGILQRLDALEWLWEHRPDRRGRLSYVQKGSVSRIRIEEYRKLRDEVERRIEEINDRFATENWTPIVYTDSYLSRPELAALYRHADVALVSPVRDGMNLVAKEYVASQLDGDGVLVLSEFAGAAESLGDAALVVNPYDTERFAAAIEAALSMPEQTRRRRMRTLRRRVAGADGNAWIRSQFRGVDSGRGDPAEGPAGWRSGPVSIWSQKRWLADRIRSADGLFVMTDFDGTIADIVSDPERAEIRESARESLGTIADHPRTEVAIVSGRGVDDVRERAALDDIYYAGNHGFELWDGDERSVHAGSKRARDVLSKVCEVLERRFDGDDGDDGVSVENKEITATVHYRRADRTAEDVLAAVRNCLALVDDHDTLCVAEGKEVVELRPNADWGKDATVELLRARFTPDDEEWLPVYVGDDTSDESAFEAIDGDGVAVTVGSETKETVAPYVVSDTSEVVDLLGWLADEGLANLDVAERKDATAPGKLMK